MTVKTAQDIRHMEKSGRIAAEVLKYTGTFVRPGITTNELDAIAHEFTLSKGATSACIGYHGYPKAICSSVNDIICHGLPDGTVLKDGDIINLDVTVLWQGFHGDTSAMFYVGTPTERGKKIVDCAFGAMHKGIDEVTAGATTGDIGFAVNKFVSRAGFHAVREIGGHGIGRGFHEEPFVPSFGKKGKGVTLLKWATITVEPMVNETSTGLSEISIPDSNVKVYKTADGSWSAQYEHTVLVTDGKPQILTICD